PGDVVQELPDGAANHGPTPDDGGAFRQQEADGNDLDAEALSRPETARTLALVALFEAEHGRQVWASDVCVDDADFRAGSCECDREVGRDGGLADAALVRGDGDDVANAGNRLLPFAGIRREDPGAPFDVDFREAERFENSSDIAVDGVAKWAGRRGEFEIDLHPAAFDGDVLDHAKANNARVEFRV